MLRQRGFTLVEVLAGLVILALVITTTLATFLERNRRLAQASETILAYQALANEAEIIRRVDFDSLVSSPSFRSETFILAPLSPFATVVRVTSAQADVKQVVLVVSWKQGTHRAELDLTRVNTGGSNFW